MSGANIDVQALAGAMANAVSQVLHSQQAAAQPTVQLQAAVPAPGAFQPARVQQTEENQKYVHLWIFRACIIMTNFALS